MIDPILAKLRADAAIVWGDLWQLLTLAERDEFAAGRERDDDPVGTVSPMHRRTAPRERTTRSNGSGNAPAPLFWHFID